MFHQLRIARGLCLAGAILTVSGATLGLSGSATFAESTTPVSPGSQVSVGNSPYSTLGKVCDPNRDGYHFIMNGLEYPAESVIDGADFGPINITFSDLSVAVATFTDLAGGSTAHFLNSTVNQTGNFTITSATMVFPAGTDITGFGNFVISHPPCGTTDTTTTVEETTTTVEETTTTVEQTTTTVQATTTTTVQPTTTLAQTTTTLAQATTTTLLASQGPAPTTTAPVAKVLPATGVAGGTAVFGVFVLLCGLTLLGLSRRRTVQS